MKFKRLRAMQLFSHALRCGQWCDPPACGSQAPLGLRGDMMVFVSLEGPFLLTLRRLWATRSEASPPPTALRRTPHLLAACKTSKDCIEEVPDTPSLQQITSRVPQQGCQVFDRTGGLMSSRREALSKARPRRPSCRRSHAPRGVA